MRLRTIRSATIDDLPWVTKILDSSRHQFGFWTTQAIYDAVAAERVIITDQNNQEAALLIFGRGKTRLRVFAAFTAPDARLNNLCREEWLTLLTTRTLPTTEYVTLQTAEDLPANLVWPRLGFTFYKRVAAPTHTSRPSLHWRYQLPAGADLELYLEQQSLDSRQRKVLAAFGLTEQFRACMTSRYRRRNAK